MLSLNYKVIVESFQYKEEAVAARLPFCVAVIYLYRSAEQILNLIEIYDLVIDKENI